MAILVLSIYTHGLSPVLAFSFLLLSSSLTDLPYITIFYHIVLYFAIYLPSICHLFAIYLCHIFAIYLLFICVAFSSNTRLSCEHPQLDNGNLEKPGLDTRPVKAKTLLPYIYHISTIYLPFTFAIYLLSPCHIFTI
jgi:hypothetical protein